MRVCRCGRHGPARDVETPAAEAGGGGVGGSGGGRDAVVLLQRALIELYDLDDPSKPSAARLVSLTVSPARVASMESPSAAFNRTISLLKLVSCVVQLAVLPSWLATLRRRRRQRGSTCPAASWS